MRVTQRGLLAFAAALALAGLQGCSLPRDPAGTMDMIERRGAIRLGMVEGTELNEAARRTLAQVERRTGAKLAAETGDSEELLERLEHGDLDLVYGNFASGSPWTKSVYFGKAQGWLAKPAKEESVPRLAMMRGENGWIMAIEEASR